MQTDADEVSNLVIRPRYPRSMHHTVAVCLEKFWCWCQIVSLDITCFLSSAESGCLASIEQAIWRKEQDSPFSLGGNIA